MRNLVQFALAVIFYFASTQAIDSSSCKCWVRTERRASCRYYKPNMPKDLCESLGCCHQESNLPHTPNCYRPTGYCPPSECQISPPQRISCGGGFPTRKSCFQQNCCYHDAATPKCYRSTDGSEVDEYYREITDKQFTYAKYWKPQAPTRYFKYGPYKMIGYCRPNRPKIQCGGVRTTETQCLRHMCCWDPSLGPSMRCTRSRIHVLNYPLGNKAWSSWGSWGACEVTTSCATGTRTRTRTCPGYKCTGDSTETESCSSCDSTWGVWTSYGSCVSAEPKCLIGSKTKTRSCVNTDGIVQADSACIGGSSSAIKIKSCNKELCEKFSSWSTASCSASCGGGTITKTRVCKKTPKESLPSSCYSSTSSCNSDSCSSASDSDLDILFILDSSEGLDGCYARELALQTKAPFYPGNSVFTSSNFPNFFQQNTFVTNFLASWDKVQLGNTQVAVTQHSDTCTFATGTRLHVNKYLSTEYIAGSLDATLPYYCGSDSLWSQLLCGVTSFTVGNRASIPDVVIAFIPNIKKMSPLTISLYRDFPNIVADITPSATVFTVSAADHSSMSASDVADNILFCQQYACASQTPTCNRYLGNIYDATSDVMSIFRATVNNF